jgi:hypothetical protein
MAKYKATEKGQGLFPVGFNTQFPLRELTPLCGG